MTFLVAIEGADGAGKATAASKVRDELVARGISAVVISFPRYEKTVGGFVLGEFLSGRMPVPVSAKAAAVLYGLDRFESVSCVATAAATHDIVIFDRYVASNMVYQAAKVPPDKAEGLMDWILRLEIETFGVIPPNLSIYLDTPIEYAQKLIQKKSKRSYTDLQYDQHESNIELQRHVRRNYEIVASTGLAGPWRIVKTAAAEGLRQPTEIAMEIVDYVVESCREANKQLSTISRA